MCENRIGAPIAGLDQRVSFEKDVTTLDAMDRELIEDLIGHEAMTLLPTETIDAG